MIEIDCKLKNWPSLGIERIGQGATISRLGRPGVDTEYVEGGSTRLDGSDFEATAD